MKLKTFVLLILFVSNVNAANLINIKKSPGVTLVSHEEKQHIPLPADLINLSTEKTYSAAVSTWVTSPEIPHGSNVTT